MKQQSLLPSARELITIQLSQLARYATTIASRGTSYSISLLDKVTDSQGNLVKDYTPEIINQMDVSDSEWDIIHNGMREVVEK